MRTVLVLLYFILFLGFLIILLIPYLLLLLIRSKPAEGRFRIWVAHSFARSILSVAGTHIETEGLEHVPETDRVCFVSNHQGLADILIIAAYMPKQVGFIAKKELKKIPIFNIWMLIGHCIFLDRGNLRQAAGVIDRGAEYIDRGYPLVVFPEGTRSRGPQMGLFKKGSLKVALRSKGYIVPISVSGSYKVFEEHGWIKPAIVRLVVHPPIDVGELETHNTQQLSDRLYSIIQGGLDESFNQGTMV